MDGKFGPPPLTQTAPTTAGATFTPSRKMLNSEIISERPDYKNRHERKGADVRHMRSAFLPDGTLWGASGGRL